MQNTKKCQRHLEEYCGDLAQIKNRRTPIGALLQSVNQSISQSINLCMKGYKYQYHTTKNISDCRTWNLDVF